MSQLNTTDMYLSVDDIKIRKGRVVLVFGSRIPQAWALIWPTFVGRLRVQRGVKAEDKEIVLEFKDVVLDDGDVVVVVDDDDDELVSVFVEETRAEALFKIDVDSVLTARREGAIEGVLLCIIGRVVDCTGRRESIVVGGGAAVVVLLLSFLMSLLLWLLFEK